MVPRSFVGILLFATLPAWAQPCEAPSKVKAAIEAGTLPPARPMEERIAAAKKVREQFPEDYFAHRFYQGLFFNRGLFSQSVQDEYRALLDTHPDNPTYQMLYVRTLTGTNTPAAIKLLDKMLERQPDHALAHLKLVEIYAAAAFRDDQKLAVHAAAYLKACPSSFGAYSYITRIDDPELVRNGAAHLRGLLDGAVSEEALSLYNTLWTLEFKTTPLSAQEPLRARLRKDVDKLRAQDLTKHAFLLNEIGQAYKMLGDADGTKWVDEQTTKNGSHHSGAATEAIGAWHRAHPYKSGFERDAFQELVLKETEGWIRQWPEDPEPRRERFMAMRGIQDTPLEEAVTAAQDWLRVYAAHPGGFMAPYLSVAQFYAQHNMHYGELPELLEKALQKTPVAEPGPVSDLGLVRGPAGRWSKISSWSEMNSAINIYLKIKKYDRAQELLAKLGPALLKDRPAASEPESDTQQFRQCENYYWNNMSKWARAVGHKLEALTYERNSMLADPYPNANPTMEQYRTSSLRELWKEINGSEDGFEAWMTTTASANPYPGPKGTTPAPKASVPTVVASQSAWTKMDKALPDFQISDAEGKTWRLADLKGKVALVNLWATWCGPCRAELPYLQKLFNKVRERKDLVVITLNTDENPGLILPFLTENKYTFPVLPASGYVAKLVPELSIPRNWIVDADGVLKMERIGFGNGEDGWVDEMVGVMEKARPAVP
jgi:thiol-disulfide isomerase/thioredoxin